MRRLLPLLCLLLLTGPALAREETFRDAQGRITGTRSDGSTAGVTFRDGSGRVVGTESRDTMDRVTMRDAQGRVTGTR